MEPVGVPVGFDRHVRADRRQELRDRRVLAPRIDLLGELALELRLVGEDVLDRAVVREQLRGRLLADASDARDVVRRVAREGEIVDHLRGRSEMPALAHLRLVVDLGGVARMGGTVEPDARTHQLRRVLVGRRHVDVEAGGGGLHRQGAHHVVGLEAVDADDGDLQRLGKFERIRDRGGEVLGHLLALRLVGRVRRVAERGSARIHRQDGVRRPLLLEDGLEAVHEADERRGVDARRRHARIAQEDEMALVKERHQINDEKLVHEDPFGLRLVFGFIRGLHFASLISIGTNWSGFAARWTILSAYSSL